MARLVGHRARPSSEDRPRLLCVNPIIYSKVSIRFTTIEALEDALPPSDHCRQPIPWAAAFPTISLISPTT
jgi:hypothetical protein